MRSPFLHPGVIGQDHHRAPTAPGFSAAMRSESVAEYTFPGGGFWAADLAKEEGQAT